MQSTSPFQLEAGSQDAYGNVTFAEVRNLGMGEAAQRTPNGVVPPLRGVWKIIPSLGTLPIQYVQSYCYCCDAAFLVIASAFVIAAMRMHRTRRN